MKLKRFYLALIPFAALVISFSLITSGTPKMVHAQAGTNPSWFYGYLGSMSANGGIKVTMPNLPTYTVPNTSDTGLPYFASYSAISGTGDMPLTQQSKYKEYTVNYINEATKPPIESGYTSWHDFIQYQVSKNKKTQITKLNGDQTIEGTLSTGLGIAIGSKTIYDITGNLTVNSGTVCDVKVMYLVTGTITINPDVTNTGDNGCMFIAKGNVTVTDGTQKTNVLKGAATPISYDNVYAAIITDGTLATPADNNLGSQTYQKKWDGLYFNGSITANKLDLHREPNSTDNAQPGHIFVYDARYKLTFQDDVSFRFYSIREKTN